MPFCKIGKNVLLETVFIKSKILIETEVSGTEKW